MKRSLSLLLCVLVLLTGISGLVFAADSGSVNIADPTLAVAVRRELGLSASDSLTLTELKRLEVLDVSGQNIVNFAGLESAVNLRRLTAANCQLQDATALAGMTGLEALDLSGNTLTDLSFLTNAHQLQQLYLKGTSLTSISGLEKVASTLLVLDVSQNQVADLSPLASLSKLTMLDVSDNPAADFSPVTGVETLGVLYANSLSLSSVSGISNLTGLKSLQLKSNAIADLSPLLSLEHLMDLDVTSNPLDFTSENSSKDAIAVLESKGVLVQYDPPEEEKPVLSNKLKSLSVKDVALDRPFDPNSESDTYSCTVPYEIASLTITAVAQDSEATIRIYNNALVPGETTDVIVEVSRDGVESRKYIICATREKKAPDPVDPPSNKLTALAVDGVQLDPPFDPESEILEYSCTVPYETTSLSVVAKAEHPDAVIMVYNNTLLAGKTTDVKVAVSLAGVGTRTYVIHATREAAPPTPSEPESSAPSSSQSPSSSEQSSSQPSSAPSSSSQPSSSSTPSSSSQESSGSSSEVSSQPSTSSQGSSSSQSSSSQGGGSSSNPGSSSSPSDSHAPSPSDPGASSQSPSVNSNPSSGSSSGNQPTQEPDPVKIYSTKLSSLTVLSASDSSYRQTVPVQEDSILLTCTVPSSVSQIDIEAICMDEEASVSVIGRELPPGKTVPVFIGVSHPQLRTRFYILLVTREAEESAAAGLSLPSDVTSTRLKELSVAETSLNTAYSMYNPFETYSCTVSAQTDALTIQAVPADDKATVTIENNDLKPGATTVVRVTVSREGLPSRHYEIKVTRPALPAQTPSAQPETTASNRLAELAITGVTLDYPFRVQNRGETYTCTVPYDMNTLDIQAVAADPEAKVTILNNVLVIGQTTTVSIKVQRAGLPTLYYSILATRPASPAGGTGGNSSTPADSSATSNKLKELSVRGVEFDFPFRENNPGETYACTVPASMSALDITAVPVDPNAKVDILFNSLEPGKTTSVVIAVTPVSGDTLYYTIKATRPATRAVPSGAPPTMTATAQKALPAQVTPVTLSGHSNKLKSLEIEGATFVGVPFRPTNSGEDYEIIAPAGATELKITAVPMDSEATYDVLNNKLTPGTTSVVSIRVSHPGMDDLYYTLRVTVPAGEASSSKAPVVNTGVNALKSLSVEEAQISPVYSTEDTMRIYYCTVPHHVESLTINAVPFEEDAKVTITGNNLVAGQETAVTVSVARHGKTTQNYIIMATREEGYVPQSQQEASSLPESSLPPSEPLPESSAPSLPEEPSQDSASSKPPANSSRSALGISIAILLISAAVAVTVVFLNQRPMQKKKFPKNKE